MTEIRSLTSNTELKPVRSPLEIEEAVRRRAYEFYEQRGYVDGHDLEGWLLAEEEVNRALRQRTAASMIFSH
jgi:hypothetical protein